MKLGVLFSGGKDSTYAAWLAKKEGHQLTCLISIISKNLESYMFHTPNIEKVKIQAEVMNIPLVLEKTQGIKEKEIDDLKKAIQSAVKKYKIQGIVTGAIQSVYQASRIQEICNKLNLECFNPLWQKDEMNHLNDLIKNKFDVVLTGVYAYPLDQSWLLKKIDKKFLKDILALTQKYKINPAGEGGEYETLVLNCPLFKAPLKIKNKKISGEKNSWKMEIELI